MLQDIPAPYITFSRSSIDFKQNEVSALKLSQTYLHKMFTGLRMFKSNVL